jgi:hypothetical protein
MKCPNCQTRELVVIGMVMNGTPVSLNSCSSCDLRWWRTGEGNLPLAGVLDLAAARN